MNGLVLAHGSRHVETFPEGKIWQHHKGVAGARIWMNPVYAHTESRERKQETGPGFWTPLPSDKLLPAFGDTDDFLKFHSGTETFG